MPSQKISHDLIDMQPKPQKSASESTDLIDFSENLLSLDTPPQPHFPHSNSMPVNLIDFTQQPFSMLKTQS